MNKVSEATKKTGYKNKISEKDSFNLNDKNNKQEKILVILTVVATIVLIIVLMFVFNVFNLRVKLQKFTTDYDAIIADIAKQKEELSLEEERVNELIKSQMEKEEELSKRESEVNERERQLIEQYGVLYQAKNDGIESVDNTQQTKEDNKVATSEEEENEQLKKTVKIYESMEPKNAAQIISALTQKEMVEIFKNMKRDSAAAILALMDSAKSAKVLSEISKGK